MQYSPQQYDKPLQTYNTIHKLEQINDYEPKSHIIWSAHMFQTQFKHFCQTFKNNLNNFGKIVFSMYFGKKYFGNYFEVAAYGFWCILGR